MAGINKDGLVTGAVVLGTILVVAIGLFVTTLFGGVLVGKVSSVAQNESLQLSSAMQNFSSDVEDDYIDVAEDVTGNLPLIIGLVAIVVLAIIFSFRMQFGSGGRGKGGVA